MSELACFRYLYFVIAFTLIACSVQQPGEVSGNVPEQPSISTIDTTRTILPSATPEIIAPTLSVTPPLTIVEDSAMVSTTISTTISVSTQRPVLRNDCPTHGQSQSLQMATGNLLFGIGRIVDEFNPNIIYTQPGIWAISPSNLIVQLLQASSVGARISPDGTTLLDAKRDSAAQTQEAVFYNIVDGEELARVTLPYDSWFHKWFPNDQVQFGKIFDRGQDAGEAREYYLVNLATQNVDTSVQSLALPDFAYNDSELERWGRFYGYEAVDPTGQLILYSAQREGNNGFEIRLLDLQNREVIWRHDTVHLSSSVPQWSEDGSYVLFDVSIPIEDTNSVWWKLISLTRNGHENELPPQPFPFVENGQLNHYSLSPDDRYIFYTAWEADTETLRGRNRAFIVDTMTWEVGEICDDVGSIFVASIPADGQKAGYWIDNDQFVYRVLIDKEGQLTHSLRVLDIPSWAAQVIFEPAAGEGVNFLGWTPIELP